MKRNIANKQSMEKIEAAKDHLAEIKAGYEAIESHIASCRARKGDLINQESAARQNLNDAVTEHRNAVQQSIVKPIDPKQIEELKQGILKVESSLKNIRDNIRQVENELAPLTHDAHKAAEYVHSAERELWMAIFTAEKAKNGETINDSVKRDILRLYACRNKAERIPLEQFMGDLLDIKFNDDEAQRMAAEHLPEILKDYDLE
jgi:chromosome segregation ATPase